MMVAVGKLGRGCSEAQAQAHPLVKLKRGRSEAEAQPYGFNKAGTWLLCSVWQSCQSVIFRLG